MFHPHAYHMKVIGNDGRGLDSPYWKDTLPIASGERIDVLVPVKDKKDKICMSCGLGKGLSIAHDHNLRGETLRRQIPARPADGVLGGMMDTLTDRLRRQGRLLLALIEQAERAADDADARRVQDALTTASPSSCGNGPTRWKR